MAYVSIPRVEDAGGVFVIDTRHIGNEGTVAVFLVPGEARGFTLVETGPASTLAAVKVGIQEAGFELENLENILLTHIHLDHAGAAGALAAETGATVYVHDIGAPHLIDPSRLMASATRIYGNKMDTLWGPMTPISEAQIKPLHGGETLKLGGHTVKVIYTPGHASHHVAYLLDEDALFTGDAAAIHLRGSSVVRPALPPPEIDLETWRETTQAMLAAKPKRLLLTHFGEVTDPETHLRRVPERNGAWAEVILEGMRAGEDDEALVKRIAAYGNAELTADDAQPEVMARHQVTSNYAMTVLGVTRYWRKHHPEKLKKEG
ncbi:MBL fold metallo-hydrolase [soil metagenome]